jgi:16S rRNA (cytosine967-C5)-methyltransferase
VKLLSKTFKRPIKDAPRLLAFEVFTEVIRNGAYSNLLLPQRLSESELDRRDRAFVTELVYGTIRQLGRNDAIAAKFSQRPWSEVDAGVVDVIRLGAYQLFDMRVPTHAAVDATVNLARQALGESKATFVNAIMRKLSSQELSEHLSDYLDNSNSSLAIRYSHPEWIINSYRDFIADPQELIELLECNNQAISPTLVAWPGKSSQEELLSLGASATQYSKYGAVFNGAPNELAPIRARRAGVQDEGSQLLAQLFASAASKNEPWLDLCAGPGGKAALISFLAKEPIYANEVSETRAKLVTKVVRDGTHVLIEDGRTLKLAGVGSVLADVPCTGLGALRRRPEIRWRRTANDLPGLTKLQFELATNAISLIPNGGIFGYATCSPHMAETVAQCAAFEKKFSVERIDVAPILDSVSRTKISDATRNGFMQLWPHRHGTDAMFLALYRKR